MPQNEIDPSGSTQMFRAFVARGEPSQEQKRSSNGTAVRIAAAVAVLAAVAVILAVAL